MDTLRVGSKGELVEHWQFFLRGLDLYFGEADGVFGEQTKLATQEFQRRHALKDDGIAGNVTLGTAMSQGFHVVDDNPVLPDTLDPPPKPSFPPFDLAARQAAFGKYPFVPAPVPANPEAIRITSNWIAENIVSVEIPQLKGVSGAPGNGVVQFHQRVAPRAVALFQAWENAGLRGLILSYAGSFVPRFIRGSRSILSQHAFGSAFDINAQWNGFGATPAALGARGSVRALVPIANELGFYWGGHFARRDGMHFEIGKA
ncbi:MAG TPA: M15 family metallopeptidase [Polyangiaceae bacterium]|nr:M15 family metallopeptidase [Polyangiaceae bacterium]